MSQYKTSYKKFGNQKTEYNGYKYDSKFEAGVARIWIFEKGQVKLKTGSANLKLNARPITFTALQCISVR